MRLLLDECVDEHLRRAFSKLECQTVRFAGLAGFENGRLLDAAEEARPENQRLASLVTLISTHHRDRA